VIDRRLDDYQARAAKLTPPDASPEVRGQVTRMARIEQARADRAWQAARGRAATGALDWLGENPAAPLMAMPTDLRDGLSPEQSDALDRTAMNGGRVVTDRDLYDRLDDQEVRAQVSRMARIEQARADRGPGVLSVGIDVGSAYSLVQEQATETVALEGRIGFAFDQSLLEFGQAVVVAVAERQPVLRCAQQCQLS